MASAPDNSTLLYRPTFAEVDLDAYDRNIVAVRSRLPESSRMIAVLKADGYGHGAVELARRCAATGVTMIAVALLEEALEVSRAGLPVLILGTLTPPQIEVAARRRWVMGVAGPEALRDVCEYSNNSGRKCSIHLKLDSGMGRMGLIPDDLADAVERLRGAPKVRVEAIYTHYAAASDPDHPLTGVQRSRFASMLAALRAEGITAPDHHLANSAAVMRGLVEPGDFVRVGLAFLGAEPLDRGRSRLEPVLTLRSEIARLKELGPGNSIGYGATFETARESLIATVPVGYADGYDRRLSNNAEVLIRGQRAPVVGRVSMDLITVDVTDVPEVAVGDVVILVGREGAHEIAAEELAARTSTIPYEVFCRISARVPRLYRSGTTYWVRSKFRT